MRCFAFLSAATLGFVALAYPAAAQLEPWKDFDVSDSVWEVTMIKVHPNMTEDYLEGIRDTWAAANKIAMKLGHIEDYTIFSSTLPSSGDFNLMLVVKFENGEAMAPNKARYDAFMKEWGASNQERSRKISKDYPGMRGITGQYALRELTIK